MKHKIIFQQESWSQTVAVCKCGQLFQQTPRYTIAQLLSEHILDQPKAPRINPLGATHPSFVKEDTNKPHPGHPYRCGMYAPHNGCFDESANQ